MALRLAGRLAAAREALGRATRIDPSSSAAWFALGLTAQDLGDDAGAAEAYAAALLARADFAEAAVNLGIARQATGDIVGAMTAYRQAVGLRPDALGRVTQAVTSARTGALWLDVDAFRRALTG